MPANPFSFRLANSRNYEIHDNAGQSIGTGNDPNVWAASHQGVNPYGENVHASMGAGQSMANPSGTDWGSRFGQGLSMQAAQGQHDQAAQAATALRNTNTPGGAQQWGNMMQGLQNARSMMSMPGYQQAQASALRNTNTPGGVAQWGQQQRPNWQQMMGGGRG